MQRPKWLRGWAAGKNVLKGWLIIDMPEVKVVEFCFEEELVLIGIGTERNREEGRLVEKGVEPAACKCEPEMKWKIFYDKTAFPDFIPFEKLKDFMAGVVAMTSGSASVYDAGTTYIASGKRPTKGNAPLLLEYEIARKIMEAKGLSSAYSLTS
ncbi:MAG: hypothetical protein QXH87_01935 [Candidatus Bathyarchaeia archaeon]